MPKKKTKKPSWISIKKSLSNLDHDQLIESIKDLYQLSEEAKSFLHARFSAGDDSRRRYKKVILDALYPDVMGDYNGFDFERAEKAITDYAKATSNDEGTVDLMIYYVEYSNKFTRSYGDIDEYFYDALIEMYEKAVGMVRKMPLKKRQALQKRLKNLIKSSEGIGWGYHDGIGDAYYEGFEK